MPDFEPPTPRLEPTPRWIRVRAGDTWIADSRRAQLLVWFGPGRLPTYVLPPEDVRTDLLTPEGDLHLDGRVLERVATRFGDDDPAPTGHWTFTWDGRLSWFEEAMEVAVHARDPTKRVDAMPSERHVEIRVGGELVAESRSAHALFETGLPTRWYLPAQDVRHDLLEHSDTSTSCRTRAPRATGTSAWAASCTTTSRGPTRSRFPSAPASRGSSPSSTSASR
jgi:uncharacterized protein (DUF427 family)